MADNLRTGDYVVVNQTCPTEEYWGKTGHVRFFEPGSKKKTRPAVEFDVEDWNVHYFNHTEVDITVKIGPPWSDDDASV